MLSMLVLLILALFVAKLISVKGKAVLMDALKAASGHGPAPYCYQHLPRQIKTEHGSVAAPGKW